MYFDDQARIFDTSRRQARAKLIANRIRHSIRPAYATAMEFGCGTGLIGMELIDTFASIPLHRFITGDGVACSGENRTSPPRTSAQN